MKGAGVIRQVLHRGNLNLMRMNLLEMSEDLQGLMQPLKDPLSQVHLGGLNLRIGQRLTSADMNANTECSAITSRQQGI